MLQALRAALAYLTAAFHTVPTWLTRLYKAAMWQIRDVTDVAKLKQLHRAERAQVGGRDLPGVIIMLGTAIVVGFLVIAIASDTIDVAGLTSGDPLYNASQSLQSASNNVFSLIGLVFLAVILAVVVFYLYGVRGMNGR